MRKDPRRIYRALANLSGGVALVVFAACSGTDRGADQTTAGKSAGGKQVSDAEILAVLSSVNQGEIRSARMAQDRSASPVIDQYAQHMLDDHKKVESEVQGIAEPDPAPSALSLDLEQQAAAEMADLERLSGAEFDRAYAASQAAMHKRVLDTVDSTLLPSSQSPEIRALLETMRPQIAEHLTRAQQLESTGATAGGAR
jgi:putative membrane protein